MSNQAQIKKPSRVSSRIKLANTDTTSSSQDKVWVHLPKDMYLHTPIYNSILAPDGCQTEWWWHIGTLKSKDGARTFGFEINACALYEDVVMFSEVMLTDVKKQKHYHESVGELATTTWAESDPTKPWSVQVKKVSMTTGPNNPTSPSEHMIVTASLADGNTNIEFNLSLKQQGLPLVVFGDGTRLYPGQTEPNLGKNNYYFSLTRLQASGTITITEGDSSDSEVIEVTGTTWMDHEWGNFTDKNKSTGKSQSVQWILQDMQFDNGICLSNFALNPPTLNEPMAGMATVQLESNGKSHYVETTMTPTKAESFQVQETNPTTKKTEMVTKSFFTEIVVNIPEFGIEAIVTSLMSKQLFSGGIYEGVAIVEGVINPPNSVGAPEDLSGTAWVEQNFSPKKKKSS